MGYHRREIPPGEFGEVSKIHEEYVEFRDSIDQGNAVMAFNELADMLGAIEGWLQRYHPSVRLEELMTMKDATRRAFLDGTRKSKLVPKSDVPSLGLCLGCGLNACGPYWCTFCGAT